MLHSPCFLSCLGCYSSNLSHHLYSFLIGGAGATYLSRKSGENKMAMLSSATSLFSCLEKAACKELSAPRCLSVLSWQAVTHGVAFSSQAFPVTVSQILALRRPTELSSLANFSNQPLSLIYMIYLGLHLSLFHFISQFVQNAGGNEGCYSLALKISFTSTAHLIFLIPVNE